MFPLYKPMVYALVLGLVSLISLSGCSREYALAVLEGMEQRLAAPRSYSTYMHSTRTSTSITTCSASVYGGSCYTSTRSR